MDPLTLALLGGGLGLGLLKGNEAKRQEHKDRILAAQTQRYSPWTKMQAQPVQRAPGMLSSGLEGGLSGMAIGQSVQNYGNQQDLHQAQLANLKAQNDYWKSKNSMVGPYSTVGNGSSVSGMS